MPSPTLPPAPRRRLRPETVLCAYVSVPQVAATPHPHSHDRLTERLNANSKKIHKRSNALLLAKVRRSCLCVHARALAARLCPVGTQPS